MSERPRNSKDASTFRIPTPEERIEEVAKIKRDLKLPVMSVKFTEGGVKTFAGSNNPLDLGSDLGEKSQLATATSKEQGKKAGRRKH